MKFFYFCVALMLLASDRALAQRDTVFVERPVPMYGLKDGATATIFSVLIPGAGQMYAGRGGKGFVIFALSAGSALAAANAIKCDTTYSFSNTNCESNAQAFWIVGGISWLYGVLTANGDVEEHNSRIRRRARASLSSMGGGMRVRIDIPIP